MGDVNSNGIIDNGNSFMLNNTRNTFNNSIISSKPPLVDSIKNNFPKMMGLNSAGILNNGSRRNATMTKLTNINLKPTYEPKSSMLTYDGSQKPATALKKPPMVPKLASPNKGRDMLEPPDSNLNGTIKLQKNVTPPKASKGILKQQSPLSANNIKFSKKQNMSIKSATLQNKGKQRTAPNLERVMDGSNTATPKSSAKYSASLNVKNLNSATHDKK